MPGTDGDDALLRLRRNYAAAFARHLFHRDEAALSAAYELGRHSLETGVSLLDVVQIHHTVLIEALCPCFACEVVVVAVVPDAA